MDGKTVAATFATRYVEPVLEGEKTKTIRYDFGPVGPGDTFVMVTEETGETFGQAFVAVVWGMTAETLVHPEVTLLEDGHRDYADIDELADHLGEFYSDAEIGADTQLTIVEWGGVEEVNLG